MYNIESDFVDSSFIDGRHVKEEIVSKLNDVLIKSLKGMKRC